MTLVSKSLLWSIFWESVFSSFYHIITKKVNPLSFFPKKTGCSKGNLLNHQPTVCIISVQWKKPPITYTTCIVNPHTHITLKNYLSVLFFPKAVYFCPKSVQLPLNGTPLEHVLLCISCYTGTCVLQNRQYFNRTFREFLKSKV